MFSSWDCAADDPADDMLKGSTSHLNSRKNSTTPARLSAASFSLVSTVRSGLILKEWSGLVTIDVAEVLRIMKLGIISLTAEH